MNKRELYERGENNSNSKTTNIMKRNEADPNYDETLISEQSSRPAYVDLKRKADSDVMSTNEGS